MFEVPMNRCCKLFEIKKKLGLKAFLNLTVFSEQKNEKSRLNILVDPLPVTARNTDEQKVI